MQINLQVSNRTQNLYLPNLLKTNNLLDLLCIYASNYILIFNSNEGVIQFYELEQNKPIQYKFALKYPCEVYADICLIDNLLLLMIEETAFTYDIKNIPA